MPESRQSPTERSAWLGIASSGLDLVIVIAGGLGLGWWLDRRYGWYPWATVIGAVLGMIGGLTNFLRAALAQSRRAQAADRRRADGRDDAP